MIPGLGIRPFFDRQAYALLMQDTAARRPGRYRPSMGGSRRR